MIESAREELVACLNCGQPAGPRFCGHCGQAVDDRRAALAPLVREMVEESLAVDGKMLNTLRALPRPGLLTRLYLDGKRVAFIGPFRLYLFASLALFSSLLALPTPRADQINLYIADEIVTADSPMPGRTTIRIMGAKTGAGQFASTRLAPNLARMRMLPPQELLDRLVGGFRSVLPFALISFLPVLAGALKLLYIRRRVLYVDHLVFGVHFQSAFFLALAATWLVARLTTPGFLWALLAYVTALLLMLTVYLSRALRRVYGQPRGITIAKTVVLVLAYLTLLSQVLGLAVVVVLLRI